MKRFFIFISFNTMIIVNLTKSSCAALDLTQTLNDILVLKIMRFEIRPTIPAIPLRGCLFLHPPVVSVVRLYNCFKLSINGIY